MRLVRVNQRHQIDTESKKKPTGNKPMAPATSDLRAERATQQQATVRNMNSRQHHHHSKLKPANIATANNVATAPTKNKTRSLKVIFAYDVILL